MSTKSDIINNPREYSSEEIAQAIKDGKLTIYELSKGGNMTPLMRRRIEEKLAELNSPKPSIPEDQAKPEIVDSLSESENNQIVEESKGENNEELESLDLSEIVLPSGTDSKTAEITTDNKENEKPEVVSYNMDIIDNTRMFSRPFSFKGRIRRLEYGISFIIYFIWYMILEGASKSTTTSQGTAVFLLISIVPIFWFLWAQGCKRCHDRGNSGWYQIIPFYVVVLLFGEGEDGNNDYGNNPKGQ